MTLDVWQYVITALPEDDPDWLTWSISVEFTGRGLWRVCRGTGGATVPFSLNHADTWRYEPTIREGKEFERMWRWELDAARVAAEEWISKIRVGGKTASEWLEERG